MINPHVKVYNQENMFPICTYIYIYLSIVITTINPSYWSYVHQLSYLGGSTLYIYIYTLRLRMNDVGDILSSAKISDLFVG